MEEFDDLLEQPNDSGELDMSHRAWKVRLSSHNNTTNAKLMQRFPL